MIGITVSTNYDDILDIVIAQNHNLFDKWYIITDKNDLSTIKVINKYNFSNIFTIFYNFYENNKIFNKGGAIRYCQSEVVGNLGYSGNLLILDSDIWLTNKLTKKIKGFEADEDTIYGAQRYDFYSYKNFKKNIVDFEYDHSESCNGYFQLYKYNKNKLYNESDNCSVCDL